MTLIGAENHFALLAVLFGCVAFAFWLERFAWARRLSATLLVIAVPLVLSNLGVIPRRAPVYDFVSAWFVTAAIPLLLFKADMRRIASETGRTLVAFALGAIGTAAGVAVAYLVVPIGSDRAAVAAVHTGGYIGGSMNFVAVAQMIGFDDPTRFSAVLGAETSMGLLYLVVLSALPSTRWFERWAAAAAGRQARGEPPADRLPGQAVESSEAPVATAPDHEAGSGLGRLQEMAAVLALSLAICAMGQAIAAWLGLDAYALLFITAAAVAAANVFRRPLRTVRGDTELGMLLMFVFFGVFGAGTDLVGLLRNAPILLLFSATIVLVHAVVVFGLGRSVGLDPRELAIGSNACLLGPPTAAAEAVRNGWDDLAVPGLLCGIFGYVVGNFAGVGLFSILG